MDLSNRKCKVPKVDGRVFLKVTRKVPKYAVVSGDEQKKEQASMNNYLIENDLLDFWLIIKYYVFQHSCWVERHPDQGLHQI